jgi:hypothetical protein
MSSGNAFREIVYFEDGGPYATPTWGRQTVDISRIEYSLAAIKGQPGDEHYYFINHVWTPKERADDLNRDRRRNAIRAAKPDFSIRTHLLEKACVNGTLYQQIARPDLKNRATDIAIAIKLREGWTIHSRDVIKAKNQEMRQRALKAVGNEKFLRSVEAKTIHEDKYGTLLEVPGLGFRFVRVVDPSTKNIYLLQVPPGCRFAKQAVAWTFGVREDEYNPEIET